MSSRCADPGAARVHRRFTWRAPPRSAHATRLWCAGRMDPITSVSAAAAASEPVGRAAVFDLDRTLLPGSSLLTLARAMSRRGLVSGQQLVSGLAADRAFRWRGATDDQAHRLRTLALRQVAGLEAEALQGVLREVGRELSTQVRPGVRLLLRRHQDAGDFVVILSASPQELVEVVAGHLGAHRAIGTRPEQRDGRYTGRLVGSFCYGAGKLTRLHQDLGPGALHDAAAYADSSSDLPVLEASREPVAVNPDRRLQSVARSRGWPVIRFR